MPARVPHSLAYRKLPASSANILPPFASLPSLAPFSTRSALLEDDKHKDVEKDHVLNNPHKLNVQNTQSTSGRQAKEADRNTGPEDNKHSTATSQQDVHKSAEKAKQEFPEAPDTGGKGKVLGMQDERGGKAS